MDRTLWILVVLALATAAAVGVLVTRQQVAPALVVERSDKARITTPGVSPEELAELSRGNNAFALDLYRVLDRDKNLFFSPYSISLCFGMVYAGAMGETAEELASALRFSLGRRVHPVFNALDLALTERAEASGNELLVANGVWAQLGEPLQEGFLDLLAEQYGAEVRRVDFRRDPEGCRRLINRWVEEATRGRIEELFPPGSIGPETVLALANAIYFRGTWEVEFEPAGSGSFRLLDGTEVPVEMMRKRDRLGYVRGEGYQAVEIPYRGGEFSFIVLLPDEGRFREFEENLTPGFLEGILEELSETEVKLTMPKFSLSFGFGLREPMEELGVKRAFGPEADFSGMGKGGFFITAAVHKAFIEVDEKGTEAAAATGVAVGRGLVRVTEVEVDRPFIFIIRDRTTNTILFLGRLLQP